MHSRADVATSMWQTQVFWGLKIRKFGELSLRKTSHYEYKHLVMFLPLTLLVTLPHSLRTWEPLNDYNTKEVK